MSATLLTEEIPPPRVGVPTDSRFEIIATLPPHSLHCFVNLVDREIVSLSVSLPDDPLEALCETVLKDSLRHQLEFFDVLFAASWHRTKFKCISFSEM
jgi:hypothetical protein